MTVHETRPVRSIPAREIPVPTSVSPEAQAVLGAGRSITADYPSLDDHEGWRAYVATADEMMLSFVAESAAAIPAGVEELHIGEARVFVVTPDEVSGDDPRVYLSIHGGALISGGGESCRAMGIVTSALVDAPVWAVDYRMPPDHPYPTPLDDCVAAYRALLRDHDADRVVIGGGSAGGNLAAATILRARDEGLPLPAAAVLLTPEADLTESGDSFQTNLGIDTLPLLMPVNLLYANGHDLTDPYLSPLFGDFAQGFPPTLLASGTRDLFLSNTVRMHRALRAADVEAELHVLEAAPHGGFMGRAPEDGELRREIRRFVDAHWGG